MIITAGDLPDGEVNECEAAAVADTQAYQQTST